MAGVPKYSSADKVVYKVGDVTLEYTVVKGAIKLSDETVTKLHALTS